MALLVPLQSFEKNENERISLISDHFLCDSQQGFNFSPNRKIEE